jgi:hypothetical protein
VVALAISGALLPTRAEGPDREVRWRMIGHDVNDTRSQPFEFRIGARNVSRLKVNWIFTGVRAHRRRRQ